MGPKKAHLRSIRNHILTIPELGEIKVSIGNAEWILPALGEGARLRAGD